MQTCLLSVDVELVCEVFLLNSSILGVKLGHFGRFLIHRLLFDNLHTVAGHLDYVNTAFTVFFANLVKLSLTMAIRLFKFFTVVS
jgi:hypothetical protein